MSIYGSVGSGIAVARDAMKARVSDNLRLVEQLQGNPNEMGIRIKQNNDYLELASNVLNLILRNITALQP